MTVAERFDQLRTIVDSTPADELPSALAAASGGIDGVLDTVFEVYRGNFDPSAAGDATATFQFDLATPDGDRPYVIDVDRGTCDVRRGAAGSPTATIALSVGDFLQMSLGRVNGAMLAMTGRIRVSGDSLAAMSIPDWFPN